MKKLKIIAGLLIVCFITSLTGAGLVNAVDAETHPDITVDKVYCYATLEDSFTDDEILVVINPNWNYYEYTVTDFSEIGCVSVEELAGATDSQTRSRILLLTIADGTKAKVLEAIQLLQQRSDIYCVEPNYLEEAHTDVDYFDVPALVPNDTKYESNDQWAIDKIGLPYAWNVTTGSSTVLVGIIDSGIDATHLDLTNRVNTSLGGCFTGDYETGFEDEIGHGTHVAGIIGAQSNNGLGITGTCWNVQLVSLSVAELDGSFDIAAVVAAIVYAEEVGIQILNYSGGGNSCGVASVSRETAITNYDGLFVCAAGNKSSNNDTTPHYPSNHRLPNLIAVGASTSSDTMASFSNYGNNTVDLFAPGSGILSTIPGNQYESWNGTSMAAPYVTGVAALLKALDSNITPNQIKYHIEEYVDPVSAFNGKCVTGGRLNAYMAVCTHTYSFTAEDATYHYGTCICGATKRETHNWSIVGGMEMCLDCEYIIG